MIYVLLIGISILMYCTQFTTKMYCCSGVQKKFLYYVCLGIILFLIAALRRYDVGYDTNTYRGHFERIGSYSWETVMQLYIKEPGFYILAKLISILTDNARWLLAIISAIYATSICVFLRRYSARADISVAVLVAFQFYAFSLSGLRQTIAFSVVLLAIHFAINRKILKYFLCILIAYLFHNSAICAIPIYLLARPQNTISTKTRLVFILLLPVIYVTRTEILNYALKWIYWDYQIYATPQGSWATFLLYFGIWILYITLTNCKEDAIRCTFERMLMVGIIVQLFVPLQPTIFRIAMYYQVSSLAIVPWIVTESKVKNSQYWILYMLCLAVLMIMYFGVTYNSSGANPYYFFWE